VVARLASAAVEDAGSPNRTQETGMSIRNHAIYEIDITFTRSVHYRDVYGDRTGEVGKEPGTPLTKYLVAPKYNQEIALAWVRDAFKDCDLKIVEVRMRDLDAFIEHHTY
jgi:hypothetical protein